MGPPAALPAPTAAGERALAPDLARGAMLLLIALANSHYWLSSGLQGVHGYPRPDQAGPLDRLVTGLQLVLVDGRAYPLFAALFGYGTVQLARRVRSRDLLADDAAVRLVRRRGGWMVAVGAAHAVLLFSVDVIAAYGVTALLFAGVLARDRPRALRRLVGAGLVGTALLGAFQALPAPEGTTAVLLSVGTDSALVALAARPVEWLAIGVVGQLPQLLGAVAVGALAARARLLEEPERHRRLLTRVAVVGVATAVLGGAPLALLATGVLPAAPLALELGAGVLHALSGYAGAFGYAAVFGLVAAGAARSGALATGGVLGVLRACGQRSLTCYLGQSVVFAVLLPRSSLGLGGELGVAQVSALAAVTWLVLLGAAAAMERAGRRGPAEVLLRRLTYPAGR